MYLTLAAMGVIHWDSIPIIYNNLMFQRDKIQGYKLNIKPHPQPLS